MSFVSKDFSKTTCIDPLLLQSSTTTNNWLQLFFSSIIVLIIYEALLGPPSNFLNKVFMACKRVGQVSKMYSLSWSRPSTDSKSKAINGTCCICYWCTDVYCMCRKLHVSNKLWIRYWPNIRFLVFMCSSYLPGHECSSGNKSVSCSCGVVQGH